MRLQGNTHELSTKKPVLQAQAHSLYRSVSPFSIIGIDVSSTDLLSIGIGNVLVIVAVIIGIAITVIVGSNVCSTAICIGILIGIVVRSFAIPIGIICLVRFLSLRREFSLLCHPRFWPLTFSIPKTLASSGE